jgi:putative transcriptional regulator
MNMELDYDFFSVGKNIEPKQGRVLISEPFLSDIYFKRSIVFLTEHNDQGTVGFVLNKPVRIPVNEVLENFPEIEAEISLGGPVGTNTVHYIHTLGDLIPNSVRVYKDIFWGGEFDTVKNLIKSGLIKKDQIRFFVGYAGWKPKQLENEISENSWVIGELAPKIIMEIVDDDIWKETLKEMGKKYKLWADFPENPGMN